MNLNYNLDDIKIPNYTVLVRLAPKENVTEENGLYLLSKTISLQLDNGQVIHVPDPNVFMAYGEVVKTGNESTFKVGDLVYVTDEVSSVRINIDENNPYPHMMPYGFWINPSLKYKVQTDLIHIPETLINAWVSK